MVNNNSTLTNCKIKGRNETDLVTIEYAPRKTERIEDRSFIKLALLCFDSTSVEENWQLEHVEVFFGECWSSFHKNGNLIG